MLIGKGYVEILDEAIIPIALLRISILGPIIVCGKGVFVVVRKGTVQGLGRAGRGPGKDFCGLRIIRGYPPCSVARPASALDLGIGLRIRVSEGFAWGVDCAVSTKSRRMKCHVLSTTSPSLCHHL